LIRIHDFQTGQVVALLRGHTDVVHALAFSTDGRWLALGSADKTVRVRATAGSKRSMATGTTSIPSRFHPTANFWYPGVGIEPSDSGTGHPAVF
jgi:WD40 repeat protein